MVSKEEVYEYSYQNRDLEYIKDKLIEEMSELTKELIKSRHNRLHIIASPNVCKEFADVRLMMRQLEYIYNLETDHKFSYNVDKCEQYKCNKLWAIWHKLPLPEEPL